MGQKQNQNTLFHILCPKTRPTEHPRLLITSLTIKELSVYPFFSQQCSGLFTKLCALPSVLPFDGWTSLYAEQFLARLDFYKKSHLYAIRVGYFPSLFIFCQQNCNSEGLICLFVQYSETIKEPACSQLLSNSPPPHFFPLLTGYHLAVLCALDSVISGTHGKPAATKRGIPSIRI